MANDREHESHVSTGNWFFTIILSAIPVVNFIMAIVWSIAGRTPSKRHYGVALLIYHFVLLLSAFALLVLCGSRLVEWTNELNTWLHALLEFA